jgi:Na+-transporting methylmalonyl-CoA/oxaloacetate decarboxylase gamma subunit
MTEPDVLGISMIAFGVVFALLSLLAVVMRGLTALFPEPDDGPDDALIAAVTTVAAEAYPGTRITEIEEVR